MKSLINLSYIKNAKAYPLKLEILALKEQIKLQIAIVSAVHEMAKKQNFHEMLQGLR